MTTIKRIVLDVLKPHRPDGLEFSTVVASRSPGCRLVLTVTAVDEQTESVVLAIEGPDLQYDAIATGLYVKTTDAGWFGVRNWQLG